MKLDWKRLDRAGPEKVSWNLVVKRLDSAGLENVA